MKIKIRNFGPIRSFDFNTKDDFVLIVGQNNIGKSYAISLVYLILKTLVLSSKLSFGYFDESGFDEFDTIPGAGLKNWFPNFKEKVTGLGEYTNDIDVSNDIAQQFGGMFEAMILPRLRESLYGTYNDLANLQNRLTTDPMEITLETDDSEARLSLHDDKLKVNGIDLHKHKYAVRVVKAIRTVKDSSQKSIIYFPLDSPSQFEKNYSGLLVNLFFRFIQDAARDVLDMHFLPASRSGLYQALSAFGQIVAELAKNRSLLSRKIELPGIAEPLSDYFLKLSDIRTPARAELDSTYPSIAAQIEQNILRGIVNFDPKTKRLMFKSTEVPLTLDLSATSSMVSEISPIVSYLKYILPNPGLGMRRRPVNQGNRKQVLIIEEPEAHLHPELQVKLIQIFADMVARTKTKIIMTSHSNYIFNVVSNLILSRSLNTATLRVVLFARSVDGSIGTDLPVSDLGIDDQNFVDVAEEIYTEKLRLIDLHNKPK